jgi:GNAT superfamily N-acetyltransferase
MNEQRPEGFAGSQGTRQSARKLANLVPPIFWFRGMSKPDIAVLNAAEMMAAVGDLAEVLEDCVAGGASVNFMAPYSRASAAAYFRTIVDEVARGVTVLLAARTDGRIVGTVQINLAVPPNQLHRADVKKLLVHRRARGRGIGAALMQRVEVEAKARGRTVLVLDTAVGDAGERLYARAGWTRVGVIPDYALWPDGRFCDAAIFWKRV